MIEIETMNKNEVYDMKFTKMHGCGNDYVYVNCFQERVENPGEISRKISDRHFGIGSDGLILIQPSDRADFRMEMYNADGSEGSMCGNGIRCVAKYVYDYGLTDKTSLSIDTKSGIKNLELLIEDGKVAQVTVDMGSPILDAASIPVIMGNGKSTILNEPITVGNQEYHMTAVSMGNPHAVVFVENTETFPLEIVGPLFETHEFFPDRVNTEFVQILDRHTANMRVWERGSGETWACGTGTCASVVAAVINGLTEEEVLVHLLGGDLLIRYDREQNRVFMTGPATTVFEGEIFL